MTKEQANQLAADNQILVKTMVKLPRWSNSREVKAVTPIVVNKGAVDKYFKTNTDVYWVIVLFIGDDGKEILVETLQEVLLYVTK